MNPEIGHVGAFGRTGGVPVKKQRAQAYETGIQEDAFRLQLDDTAILRRSRVKEIWTYGIAFWDKECRVVAKKVR